MNIINHLQQYDLGELFKHLPAGVILNGYQAGFCLYKIQTDEYICAAHDVKDLGVICKPGDEQTELAFTGETATEAVARMIYHLLDAGVNMNGITKKSKQWKS